MDIEKLLKFAMDYFSDYFLVLFSTLRSPSLRFQPLIEIKESPNLVIPKNLSSPYVGPKINPKLFGFMLISIFIGTILNSVVFGQVSSDIFIRNTIVIITVWFLYSLVIFWLCKILRGQGSFADSISISLQLLAVAYVVSNVILFLWEMFILPIIYPTVSNEFLKMFIYDPVIFYYAVQFLFIVIYLPVTLKGIHNFNKLQLLFTYIAPLMFTFVVVSSYIQSSQNSLQIIATESRPQIVMTWSPVPATATRDRPKIVMTWSPIPATVTATSTPTP